MSTGDDAVNAAVYGEFTHSFVLDHEQTIEIVVNNLGTCIYDHQTQPLELHSIALGPVVW